jgi:hypothetical protein
MITSEAYDEAIARGLAKCLLDFHLPVRLAVIKWAVGTAGERLETFSRLVEVRAGAVEPSFRNPLSDEFWSESSRKRAIRGLDIIRRLRAGEDVEHVRNAVPAEDSHVFDMLLFSKAHRERLSGWRHTKKR